MHWHVAVRMVRNTNIQYNLDFGCSDAARRIHSVTVSPRPGETGEALVTYLLPAPS